MFFYINGQQHHVTHLHPLTRLIDYLRSNQLTGTKEACGEGGCGACTVLISYYRENVPVHYAINACLCPIGLLDHTAVTTIEGLGTVREGLQPVQHRLAELHATQCGFCTPGFVMRFMQLQEFSEADSEGYFDGNLCRCTGYRPILHAIRSLAQDYAPAQPQMTCQAAPNFTTPLRETMASYVPEDCVPVDFVYQYQNTQWRRILSLAEVQPFIGQAVFIAGHTGSAFARQQAAAIYIDISKIPELHKIELHGDSLSIGAAVTLEQFQQADLPYPHLQMLQTFLDRIAGGQVRNVATFGGNLMLARKGYLKASDLWMALLTLDAQITYQDTAQQKTIPLQNLDTMPDNALLISIQLKINPQFARFYKIARRSHNAHALVHAGFAVQIDSQNRISAARCTAGTEHQQAARLTELEIGLVGQTVAAIQIDTLLHQFESFYNDSRIRNLFFKFLKALVDGENLTLSRGLSQAQQVFPTAKNSHALRQPLMKTSAYSQLSGEAQYTIDMPLPAGGFHAAPVYSPLAHADFDYQPWGGIEGLIVEMRQRFPGTLDFVTVRDLPYRQRNMTGLGGDETLFAEGHVDFEGQLMGLVLAADEHVAWQAAAFIQQAGIAYRECPPILTIEDAIANHSFLEKNPPTNPHWSYIERVSRSQSAAPSPATSQISGQQVTGHQAHFYMETQCVLVIPQEHQALHIYTSSQDLLTVQTAVAGVLGIPQNKLTVQTRRIGGGFGGKESRPLFFAVPAAVAAWKWNKPVRLALTREADMKMVGKRHPLLGRYQAAFTSDGQITAMQTEFFVDAGATHDCTFPILDLMLLSADNTYHVADFSAQAKACRTNLPSNTAMRTFGVIQMSIVQETILEHIAHELAIRPEVLRRRHLYPTRLTPPFDTTPYGQALIHCNIADLWDDLYQRADVEARIAAVETFNHHERWRKRGISMIPMKYGVGYTASFLNQATALINIFASDGTVVVYHGGVEMGQSLDIKMAQIAADALNVPLNKVVIGETITQVIPNASSTGASTGSDLNGGAILKAAEKLRKSLEDFCQQMRVVHGEHYCHEQGIDFWNYATGWRTFVERNGQTDLIWNHVVRLAYLNRVELSATGHYKTHYHPRQDFQPLGSPFIYFNYGVAVSEVEIDVLTGEWNIRRADILYDAGNSLNPAADIGQVEGAFVQGIGFLTSEEIRYDAQGQLQTSNTWSYKIPGTRMIPEDFRVYLVDTERWKKSDNLLISQGIRSSKSAGEPPMILSNTVFFAICHAIAAARFDQGMTNWFALDAPATVERILAACTPQQVGIGLKKQSPIYKIP